MRYASLVAPRKDPLRAGRIFVLASQSTLTELRDSGLGFEGRRQRAARLLKLAVECLLIAQSDRAVRVAICDQTRRQHAADDLIDANVLFGLDWGRETLEAELVLAIDTLTTALDVWGNCSLTTLEQFVPILGQVADDLILEESN